jgi:hypothetical protein
MGLGMAMGSGTTAGTLPAALRPKAGTGLAMTRHRGRRWGLQR